MFIPPVRFVCSVLSVFSSISRFANLRNIAAEKTDDKAQDSFFIKKKT